MIELFILYAVIWSGIFNNALKDAQTSDEVFDALIYAAIMTALMAFIAYNFQVVYDWLVACMVANGLAI